MVLTQLMELKDILKIEFWIACKIAQEREKGFFSYFCSGLIVQREREKE